MSSLRDTKGFLLIIGLFHSPAPIPPQYDLPLLIPFFALLIQPLHVRHRCFDILFIIGGYFSLDR